ncbi:hypothetical protein [Natrinema altunense]|uniref:Uncharacterized protein n=1 Tax=Natrinema altunense (strain JCM 12890 / CGMCC 1.3731 / AJ2) TaxID=1227494 RepID=L9ZFZ6_NATA2|nr:hypothetical protein [Natrinema altunense]ELY85385.1 hypothetical protein C485_12793 [Natrinema altunense JCM 12890]
MAPNRRGAPDDRLVCADVLGAFGVTAADVRRNAAGDGDLEAALADALATGIDRTTVLRRTIARSDRGLACAARYSRADLHAELAAVFDAIGWSLERSAARDGLALTASDPRGRARTATITYPETPLGSDNLPAVLRTINDAILAGTDARFVLLSSGVDRWRAALVERNELDALRDRYGPRIEAVDRPLLPEHGLAAYVPAAGDNVAASTETGPDTDSDEPWPPWALERGTRRSSGSTSNVGSLIDEAEPSERADANATGPSADRASDATADAAATADTERSTTAAPAGEIDGFELRGSPAVSRRRDGETDRATERGAEATSDYSGPAGDSSHGGRSMAADEEPTDTDGFGTLSGPSDTARVSNESFGTDLAPQADDERYRALGAALDAGGTVSVRGLLEDDDFLPELPAAESTETRIEFATDFDPAAVPEAKATAEESGFEWIDSGSLDTTRVSNS